MNPKQTNLKISTWESREEIPLGTFVGGLVPEDSPRQLVVVEYLSRTKDGGWLYRVEVQDVDGTSVEETLS